MATMNDSPVTSTSNKRPWAGYIISGLPALFLLFDAVGKFVKPTPVVEGTLSLGYQESIILPLGIVLLISTVLYIIPKTSVLGAILLTGYLGGAIATHVRIDNPLFTHVLFPVYVGGLIWLGLFLRDGRLRALLPIRSQEIGDHQMENTSPNSKTMNIVGWVLTIIPSLLLIFSGVMKLIMRGPEMEEGLKSIGWRQDQLTGLGILEIACVIVYLIPQTSVLGAILLAGYMGGAMATHARVGEPFFIQFLIGVVFWLGLWLREPRLRELIPLRK